jgi:hypothetical protein
MPDSIWERRDPQKSPANGSPEYHYDVFISHCEPDDAWVQTELRPRLGAAKLRVIDFHNLPIGVPRLIGRELAVEHSRHIVVVLTPSWLASEWTEFESLLVSSEDPAGRRRRLLPLMLEKCLLPPRIRLLTYADFTNPTRRGEEMTRLLSGLAVGGDAQDVFPVFNENIPESARNGLHALADLVQLDAVRPLVVGCKQTFRDTREQIDILDTYKKVHDCLHQMQIGCHNPILQEARRFPDALACEMLPTYETALQGFIERLREVMGSVSYLASEQTWVQTLEQGREELHAALDAIDPLRLRRAVRCLDRVVALLPSRINTRLTETARLLPLPRLVLDLNAVCQQIDRLDLKETDKVAQFEEGVEALGRLKLALSTLIQDHDRWQVMDTELRRIEATLDQGTEELELSWPQLKQMSVPLCGLGGEAWVQTFRAEGDKLDAALTACDPVRIRTGFRQYRHRALERFERVDTALLKLCANLRKVGEPLAIVLEMIA